MFKVSKLYTHNRMLDAAIYVLKSVEMPEGSYRLRIRWMNRRGMDLNAIDNVRISIEEVKNWYIIN